MRFVDRTVLNVDERSEISQDVAIKISKKRCLTQVKHASQPTTSAPSPSKSKFVPRSLSVVEMMKLGKEIENTTFINILLLKTSPLAW